jgi:aryl-alcohol dehydrogenase-like predicted oxidoreductase
MQHLHEKSATWKDIEDVDACVSELEKLLPEADSKKLRAAVDLRLRRLGALINLYQVHDKPVDCLYGLVISRAIELGKGVVSFDE